jgi:hypothetical protein
MSQISNNKLYYIVLIVQLLIFIHLSSCGGVNTVNSIKYPKADYSLDSMIMVGDNCGTDSTKMFSDNKVKFFNK